MPVALFRACMAPMLAALALAACQTTAPAAPESTVIPDTEARVRIQGEAVYFEKILMPEGSQLRVQLIDNQLADTPRAALAEQVTSVGSGPYEFQIDVPRARLREGGLYGLHACLLRGFSCRLPRIPFFCILVVPLKGTHGRALDRRSPLQPCQHPADRSVG